MPNRPASICPMLCERVFSLRISALLVVHQPFWLSLCHWMSSCTIVFSSLTNFILTPVSPERQRTEKQGKRPSHVHFSGSPPGKKHRRDTNTFRGNSSCLVYWDRTGYRKFHQVIVDFQKKILNDDHVGFSIFLNWVLFLLIEYYETVLLSVLIIINKTSIVVAFLFSSLQR